MNKYGVVCILIFSGVSLLLAGCDNKQALEKAQERAEQAQQELAELKGVLSQVRRERDNLQESLTLLEYDINEVEEELFLYRQSYGDMELQASNIDKQRTAAVTESKQWQDRADELSLQLEESLARISELETMVIELQDMLAQYEDGYAADEEYVEQQDMSRKFEEIYEEQYEEPNQEPNEEFYNPNEQY